MVKVYFNFQVAYVFPFYLLQFKCKNCGVLHHYIYFEDSGYMQNMKLLL